MAKCHKFRIPLGIYTSILLLWILACLVFLLNEDKWGRSDTGFRPKTVLFQVPYLFVSWSLYIFPTLGVDPLSIKRWCSCPQDCFQHGVKGVVDQPSEGLLYLLDLIHNDELPFVGTQLPCSHFGFGLNVQFKVFFHLVCRWILISLSVLLKWESIVQVWIGSPVAYWVSCYASANKSFLSTVLILFIALYFFDYMSSSS